MKSHFFITKICVLRNYPIFLQKNKRHANLKRYISYYMDTD